MFTLRLAWRYAFSRSNRHRTASLVILAGLSAGMMAIIVMLSLMNSLQRDLLDQLKDIESFHMQVSFPAEVSQDLTVEEVVDQLYTVNHVQHVFAQVNTQVMIQNPASDRSSTARLRLIDTSILEEENPFSKRTVWMNKKALNPGELAVGGTLAARLGLAQGQRVGVTLLVSGKAAVLAPMPVTMVNAGVFRTGLSEFDQTTMIADLSSFSIGLISNVLAMDYIWKRIISIRQIRLFQQSRNDIPKLPCGPGNR